jgi:hypothetical protein
MGGVRLDERTFMTTSGGHVRVCTMCDEAKPLDEFALVNGARRGSCVACVNSRKKRYGEEGRLSPGDPERRAENWRRWSEAHREDRQRQHREYLARVKADPVKHAHFLEGRRIEHRLRREREGKPVRPGRTKHVANVPEARYLPSAPLVTLIERTRAERERVAELLDERVNGVLAEVCEDFGVSTRTFRRWRDGSQPKVRIGLAEAVLLAADVDFSAVYSYDDNAAAYRVRDEADAPAR